MSNQTSTGDLPVKDMAAQLQPVLVDLVALSLNGKQAHWHVHGRTFTQVHEQLDTLIEDARTYTDNVAERLVALGAAVDGRPATVAETTATPTYPPDFATDDKVVRAVVDQLDAVIARARQTLDRLDEVDQVTQDVVIELLRGLEKHRWMFAAQMS